jgi:hypothetical protein
MSRHRMILSEHRYASVSRDQRNSLHFPSPEPCCADCCILAAADLLDRLDERAIAGGNLDRLTEITMDWIGMELLTAPLSIREDLS